MNGTGKPAVHPQAARPSSRAALCVIEPLLSDRPAIRVSPQGTLPHGRRFPSGPSQITSRRHSTRVPRDPALEPFYARGGVLVTAHSLIAMLEVAISLIVGFALGYGVRGWGFPPISSRATKAGAGSGFAGPPCGVPAPAAIGGTTAAWRSRRARSTRGCSAAIEQSTRRLISRAARYRSSCDRNTTADDFFRNSRPAAPQLSQSFFTKQEWTQDRRRCPKRREVKSLTRLRV
jgi:hypothetical protein